MYHKIHKAAPNLNKNSEIVITKPKNLREVRLLLQKPSGLDKPSEKELLIGKHLAEKLGVR